MCWPAASWSKSYSRLREGAPPPTLSAIPFVVLLIDIAVNFWRARALHRAARDTKSQALAADALHFASDVLGSIAVIIGLALSASAIGWGDAAAAIAVAVMIALLGLRLARSTVETLLDRAPEGAAEKAAAAIRAVPGVVDVERLRVRMVGADPLHRRHREGAAHLSDRPRRGDQAQGAGRGQQGARRRRPDLHRGAGRARQ